MPAIKTILFDYDGTLHDATRIYVPAFKAAYHYLVTHYNAPQKTFSDKEIAQFLGQTPKEMWDQFGKDYPDKAKQEASKVISQYMMSAIQNHAATLYKDALDVLAYLKRKGYTLVFISNCKQYYLEAHKDAFNLDTYFTHMVCSETYPETQEKEKVLATLKPQLTGPMAIVGDRHHDIRAGKENGITTIGATYGYGKAGELDDADHTIDAITELKKIF